MNLKNKKVLVVTTTDDMIYRFIVPHIKWMQEQGATVECVCSKTGFFFDEITKETGAKMHEIAFTRFPFTAKNFKGRKQLFKLCKENKYDLIHCHQPVGGVMGRMIGKKFKIPVLYIAHGFHFFKGAPLKNNLIYKTIEKHYAKSTSALVTMNEEDFQAAKKFKAKKVYKINGIGLDLSKYKQDKSKDYSALKNELGIKDNDFVVLTVGELNQNKNTEKVFWAIKEIEDSNVKYLVCGEGPRKEEYMKFVKENNLEDRIKILGFRRDVQDILNLADVYVMPSFREGLPKATMEAMAYGLPIIASNIRGCNDLIEQGKNGFLINPKQFQGIKDGIVQIKNNPKLKEEFSKYNLEKIKNYSFEVVFAQMQKIYEEL